MDSPVGDFIRTQIPDWDDDVIATARFKAFSGQRSDWEARFQFWRGLIMKVAGHLGHIIIDTEEVKNKWFVRGGLTPLCLNHVLLDMYRCGDLLNNIDPAHPSTSRFQWVLKQISSLMGISTPPIQDTVEGKLIVVSLVQERAAQIVSSLAQNNWSSYCVITRGRFESLCGGFEEADVVMSYFINCRRAQYLRIEKDEHIEGVKISLLPVPVTNVSQLDYNMLYLHWTLDSLQKQLEVIDRRCEKSKSLALIANKTGDKQTALRHVRYLKIGLDGKAKCTGFMYKVEEVLGMISDAESTKKVSEAIQLGARLIKENGIGVEEVHACLQDLDETIASQKLIEDSLEAKSFSSVDLEDEDIEEEFARLAIELEDKHPSVQIPNLQETLPVSDAVKQTQSQEAAESLCQNLSKLELEPA